MSLTSYLAAPSRDLEIFLTFVGKLCCLSAVRAEPRTEFEKLQEVSALIFKFFILAHFHPRKTTQLIVKHHLTKTHPHNQHGPFLTSR
ncbi:hypothetical protein JIN82_15960 [Persicirhabdus sediminis]|uniref:Uncharacterized protein n=1 Tax=Persicirhabdus sediminis TaxID=454144 RepID=A0A8J7SK79_9BACT|nr:hypothetical protein [Persicirhabdus sediminis]